MRNLIKKILKESEEFDWVPELQKVVVTNRGAYYPTNLEAMLELDVTGAKEFFNKYGQYWWTTNEYENWERDSHEGADSEDFLRLKIPSLVNPKDGDICYLIDKAYVQGTTNIFKLVRVADGGEFVIADYGFKPIN